MNPAKDRNYSGSDKPKRQKNKECKNKKLYYFSRFYILHDLTPIFAMD